MILTKKAISMVYPISTSGSFRQCCILLLLIFIGVSESKIIEAEVSNPLAIEVIEINPDRSDLVSEPNGASGGRINGLASTPGSDSDYYAASEWGGLFKTIDGGRTWFRLNAHSPVASWRVKVGPASPQRVYATSFYDGRLDSQSGINISSDGGKTWDHPAQTRPEHFCDDPARRDELSAFGIAIDSENPKNIYIGTNCGLAVSNDRGAKWHYVDPTPETLADDVFDVVVHHGGIIDICGDDGHLRSINGARTFSPDPPGSLPTGQCSIAASPLEPSVLFVRFGKSLYETDDSGASWTGNTIPAGNQGRFPLVTTNIRDKDSFDLWFGDVGLYRASCTGLLKDASGREKHRCPSPQEWLGPYTTATGAHDDPGEIVFAPSGCPALLASDGGVYYNNATTAPRCHIPQWTQPAFTPHALWLFGMAGTHQPSSTNEILYFSTQDDGTFAAPDANLLHPNWSNHDCCDSFDIDTSAETVVYTSCCWSPGRENRLFVRGPNLAGGGEVKGYPEGVIPGWSRQMLSRAGGNAFVISTDAGIFSTTDIGARAVAWSKIGAATSPADVCAIQASMGRDNMPVVYAQASICDGTGGRLSNGVLNNASNLFRSDGIKTNSRWRRIDGPEDGGGFGIFSVNTNDPEQLLASFVRKNGQPIMVQSDNGGATWKRLAELDELMTKRNSVRYRTIWGPSDFTSFNGYIQPSLVALDPDDARNLIAGGVDSGLFLSFDHGKTWQSAADSGDNYIPRPRFAHFDHHVPGKIYIYVGSQGRGVWRLMVQAK